MHEALEKVAVVSAEDYPQSTPYHPDTFFPEYRHGADAISAEPNHVYSAVRESLRMLGFDSINFGKKCWNPLGEIIKPGDTVTLKPNFVLDRHYGGGDLFSIVTHPSLIRAIADYCRVALRGEGRLILADAPVDDCDFDNLYHELGLQAIQQFYQSCGGVDLEVYDLRDFSVEPGARAYAYRRKKLRGDPMGTVIVDVGRDSALRGRKGPFFGSDPSTIETQANHHDDTHRYCVSKTILSSDVLISLPKLKIHKKVGVTLNFKGFVGINTNKNYLVHYTMGTPKQGGDQAADPVEDGRVAADTLIIRARQAIRRVFFHTHNPLMEKLHYTIFNSLPYKWFRHTLRVMGLRPSKLLADTDGGDWYGNDSCWRMVADLARIVYYADVDGFLHKRPRRRIFCLVDGITGGEDNGPLQPTARRSKLVFAGENPLAVDMVCCRLMGIDSGKLPLYEYLRGLSGSFAIGETENITIAASHSKYADCMTRSGGYLAFKTHKNWRGHIELKDEGTAITTRS